MLLSPRPDSQEGIWLGERHPVFSPLHHSCPLHPHLCAHRNDRPGLGPYSGEGHPVPEPLAAPIRLEARTWVLARRRAALPGGGCQATRCLLAWGAGPARGDSQLRDAGGRRARQPGGRPESSRPGGWRGPVAGALQLPSGRPRPVGKRRSKARAPGFRGSVGTPAPPLPPVLRQPQGACCSSGRWARIACCRSPSLGRRAVGIVIQVPRAAALRLAPTLSLTPVSLGKRHSLPERQFPCLLQGGSNGALPLRWFEGSVNQ